MHIHRPWPCVLAALVLSLAAPALAQPLSTAFTFQGELDNAGTPASGTYDLKFTLFDALTGGSQVGPQLCSDNVAVVNGRVTVQLDFGAQFAGQQRFLEVWVRQDTGLSCASNTGFSILGPRQSLTAAPNALFSLNAAAAATATSAVNATNATQFNGQPASFYTNAANLTSGTIANARTSGATTNAANSLVLRDASGNFSAGTISGAFSGNGAAISALNASNITTGTLTDTLLSTNIPRLNGTNAFTGNNSFPYLGIGTANALANLHVESFGPTFLMHHNADQGAPTLYTFGGLLYFNFRNLSTTSAWDNIPANGTNTYLLMSHTGTFGSCVQDPPNTGGLYFRNILDDGNGNAVIDAHTQNTGGTNFALRFGTSGSGEAISSKRSSGGNQNGLDFYTNSAPRLSITNTGNVGIGTSSPSSLLEVQGLLPQLRLRNSGDQGGAFATTNAGTAFFGFYNPGAAPWGAVPAGGIKAVFAVLNQNQVTSLVESSPGSGAYFPRNVLDDGSGGFSITGAASFSSTLTVSSAATLTAGANSPGTIDIDSGGAATSTGLFQNQNGVLRFGASPSGEGITSKRTSGGNQYGLDLYAGNGARLSITNGGLVGVGTTAPTTALQVIGTITGSAKNFAIDHPLDPANKTLVHSCVESDEYKNMYDGTVTTDGEGLATITLPSWFPALNESFRYQLTVIDEHAPDTTFVRVARKIGSDFPDSFTIKTVPGNLEVSWQVTGVRKDAYVKAHPLVVEQDKPQKGAYLHPELFTSGPATDNP